MEISKEMINVEDVSKFTNFKESYVRQLLREGKIKGIKVGKEWRIHKKELYDFLGVETDIEMVEKEVYIKELQAQVSSYKTKLQAMEGLVNGIYNILGTS